MWNFVSDLHGDPHRYRALMAAIRAEPPEAVLLGGDLLPTSGAFRPTVETMFGDFFREFLAPELASLRRDLGEAYPRVLVILGNDDPRSEVEAVLDLAERGLWEYVHQRRAEVGGIPVYGYSYVPPTPFHNKDWERYDVSRYVDPGGVSPHEGNRTVPVSERDIEWTTIKQDLEQLAGHDDVSDAVFLFHTPPYKTKLDRAALDGLTHEGVPLDVHVGSIAVQRFVEKRQPRLTLHGHVHESARITGAWLDRIGDTVCLSAAHFGPELSLVSFDPRDPGAATRRLI